MKAVKAVKAVGGVGGESGKRVAARSGARATVRGRGASTVLPPADTTSEAVAYITRAWQSSDAATRRKREKILEEWMRRHTTLDIARHEAREELLSGLRIVILPSGRTDRPAANLRLASARVKRPDARVKTPTVRVESNLTYFIAVLLVLEAVSMLASIAFVWPWLTDAIKQGQDIKTEVDGSASLWLGNEIRRGADNFLGFFGVHPETWH